MGRALGEDPPHLHLGRKLPCEGSLSGQSSWGGPRRMLKAADPAEADGQECWAQTRLAVTRAYPSSKLSPVPWARTSTRHPAG